jgi:hypothetical protein
MRLDAGDFHCILSRTVIDLLDQMFEIDLQERSKSRAFRRVAPRDIRLNSLGACL